MLTPAPLNQGDKIALVASARKVSPEEMQPAIETLTGWGFEVVKGMYLFEDDHQFAGTDAQRWADLQMMLDDPSVKAILFARGGYGSVRIVDKLDFTRFLKAPKWLIGFSDITVFHSHLNQQVKVETLHAPMAINFGEMPPAVREKWKSAITGGSISYEIPSHLFNRIGKVQAELTGGNLSILYALSATPSDINTKGKILFIEDLDEYLYHVDRMMMNLKRSGKLKSLKGLIVGGMSDMRDNAIPFGKTAEEIILDAVREYNYPVCFGMPSGHLKENYPLILGRKVKLEVGEKVRIVF
ncbi:MAG TPA: LD-carboxypeptidase [Bacteroidia bacterium]|nr:LD-carboxypeptidase [Bacteroidia bacterium]